MPRPAKTGLIALALLGILSGAGVFLWFVNRDRPAPVPVTVPEKGGTPISKAGTPDEGDAGAGGPGTAAESSQPTLPRLDIPTLTPPPDSSPRGRDPALQEMFDSALRLALEVVAADKAGSEEEDALKEKWRAHSQLLKKFLRADPERPKAYVAYLGGLEDADAALYAGRILPFIFTEGFDEHLIAVALSDKRPSLERRVALEGLRGRGKRAAGASTKVARDADDIPLRAQATEEVGMHLTDPENISLRYPMLAVVEENLKHESADVRMAALHAVLVDRRSAPETLWNRIREMAEIDPDEKVRRLAGRLAQRR